MTTRPLGSRRQLLVFCAAGVALTACVQPEIATQRVDARNDRTGVGMSLDNRDFEQAASELARDMVNSGRLDRAGGGRYVLAISRMTNDTMLRINMNELLQTIRIALNNSGKVITTTAVGLDGPEDPMAMQARQLRRSGEFNQATVAGRGQMAAPDLSLVCRITQRNTRLDGGAQRIDYVFQATITDIRSGLAFWEGQQVISRVGSGRTVSW
jgi:uncharacterized protein (TIGR02722 family)